MKRFLIIIALIMIAVMTFTACNKLPNLEDPIITNFTDTNEKIEETKSAYEAKVTGLLASDSIPENVQMFYNGDYLMVQMAYGHEAIFYSVIVLYNTKIYDFAGYTLLKELNVTFKDDTYTLTYKDDNNKLITATVKSKEDTSFTEMKTDNKLDLRSEKIIISATEYAFQIVTNGDDGKYIVAQLYVNGTTGRLSVDVDASNIPTSIYDNKSAITSSFAAGGDRSYVIGDHFTYNVPELNNETYTVYYNENGGSAVDDFTGSVINSSPASTKSGNTLEGWYLDADLTQKVTFPYAVTANVTLFAKWTPINTNIPVVTFDENGGSEVNDMNTATISTSPVSTKTNYILEGWYLDAGLTQKVTFPYTVTANLTLYANWIYNSQTTFTITFEENGGSQVVDITGASIDSKPVSTKSGYTLEGWYLDSELTNKVTSYPYSIIANVTFYAKWVVENKAVTLMEEYFNSLNDIENGFVFANNQNPKIIDVLNHPEYKEKNEYFLGTVFETLSIDWSAPFILNQCADAIEKNSEGTLEIWYPNPENNYNKTNSITYNDTTKTYQVNLWLSKSVGITSENRWFEVTITFDEATNSLKATIKCGVDEQQITRNYIEIKKLTDGTYVSFIKQIYDETNYAHKNVYMVVNKGLVGSFAENRLTETMPNLYGQNSININDFKTGDNTLTITATDVTLNKITSATNDFFEAEVAFEEIFKSIVPLAMDYSNFIVYDYAVSYDEYFSYIEDLIYYIKNIEEKNLFVIDENHQFARFEGYYTLTITSETTSKTVEISFNNNVMRSEISDNGVDKVIEIYKLSNGYAIQKLETVDNIHRFSQMRTIDQKCYMSLSSFVNSISTYTTTTLPIDFAKNGDVANYVFENDLLKEASVISRIKAFMEAFESTEETIYNNISSANETDNYDESTYSYRFDSCLNYYISALNAIYDPFNILLGTISYNQSTNSYTYIYESEGTTYTITVKLDSVLEKIAFTLDFTDSLTANHCDVEILKLTNGYAVQKYNYISADNYKDIVQVKIIGNDCYLSISTNAEIPAITFAPITSKTLPNGFATNGSLYNFTFIDGTLTEII